MSLFRDSQPLKFFTYMMLYLGIKCALFAIFLSVITFLHLLLDHRLIDIQDWIYTNAWSIYVLILLVSFMVMTKFLALLSPTTSIYELVKLDIKNDYSLRMPFILSSVFLIACIMLGQPKRVVGADYNVIKLVVSYVGHVLFYSSKLLIFFILSKLINIGRNWQLLFMALYLMLIMVIDRYFIKFGPLMSKNSIIYLGLCICVTCFFQRSSLKTALGLIICAIAPFLTFFGEDHLWGQLFTIYELTSPTNLMEAIILSSLLCFYPVSKRVLGS